MNLTEMAKEITLANDRDFLRVGAHLMAEIMLDTPVSAELALRAGLWTGEAIRRSQLPPDYGTL